MSSAIKAVVLARGLGTRMRSPDPRASLSVAQQRAADAGMKAMMPVAGRPFLDFVLSAIADAGIHHVALVVAPEHETLRAYYEDAAPPTRLTLAFVVQADAAGTADAVLAAESWAGNDAFLVLNGDNLYPAGVLRELAALDGPGLIGFDREELLRAGNIEPARVNAYALVDVNERGYLARIVEKPPAVMVERAGPHAMVSMNCWRFDRRIFDACRDVPRSPRGELELTAAVAVAVERGVAFRVIPARAAVLDLSRRADAVAIAERIAGATARP